MNFPCGLRRPHLPPDNEEWRAQQRWVLLQEVLKRRLGGQDRRAQRAWPLTVDPPDPHLYGHRSHNSPRKARD